MPRPTLKLPAKAATDGERSRARKPLRGGAGQSSAAQRALRQAQAPAVRQPPEKPTDERSRPAPQTERDGVPAKKVYPKRGIARSTGARALPPPRSERDPAMTSVAAPPPTAAQPARAPRRPLIEPPRLAKRVAAMTGCSRRQADEWIENGWVSVDGEVVTTLGSRVQPSAHVEISDDASGLRSESVTILLNKPAGVDGETVSGAATPLLQLICGANRWAEDGSAKTFAATHLRGLKPAGKLDAAASGLVVLTQEGSVARRITGDETRAESEYLVRVDGELSPEGLALLGHGLELDAVKLKRAQVSWQNERQLRFVLHENRKRQIVRMCEQVGLRVLAVKRIRIGSVSLGKLPAGQWRYLRDDERF